jgi:hypothetical protein
MMLGGATPRALKITTSMTSSNPTPRMQGAATQSRHHARRKSVSLKTRQKVKWASIKDTPMLHKSRRHHPAPSNPNAPRAHQLAATTRATLEARMHRESGTPSMPLAAWLCRHAHGGYERFFLASVMNEDT